jgi:predicted HTH transcriptional regulator
MFFLTALQQQKCKLSNKVELEKLSLAVLSELEAQIIDYVRDHGRVTISDMVRVSGANRNTIKGNFRRIVKLGFLQQNGIGKSTWYALP